jgi:hypothetical protein
LRLLSYALQGLTRLRELTLHIQDLFAARRSGSWILDRCNSKLHKLVSNFPIMDHIFLSFLQKQDELRVLEFYDTEDLDSFMPEPSLLPHHFLPSVVALSSVDVDAFRLRFKCSMEHLQILNSPWSSGWQMGFAHVGPTLKSLAIPIDVPMVNLAIALLYTPELQVLSPCNMPSTNVSPSRIPVTLLAS